MRGFAYDFIFIMLVAFVSMALIIYADVDPGALALGGLLGYVMMDAIYTRQLMKQAESECERPKEDKEEEE